MKFLLVEENKKESNYLRKNNLHLNESLHSLGSDCFITNNPYDIRNLIMNKPKLYRILYDSNIDMYMIGDGYQVIHWEMIQKAYNQGYYANQEEFINRLGGTLDNYVDTGTCGLYSDDYEVDPYLLYMIFSPDDEEFVLGEDGYDGQIKFNFGYLFLRDADQEIMNNCSLIKILEKQNRSRVTESISHQDEKAVREFADECKEDGLPLMDYKEFSELLNEQGMKPNEELYQIYVDAYSNEEDTDYIEVIKKKFEKMSSNEIIDLLGIPNSSNIDSDSPMFLLPNGAIISVAQAGKLIGEELKSSIHSDMIYVILKALANKHNYNCDIDGTYNYEEQKLNYLTYGLDWARLNCGETWTEKRFYCVLPNHMTSAQYRSLEKWLEWGADTGKEEVLVYVGKDEVNQTYRFKETFPEDIIKRIKRYYSSGRLYECELKENMNIPNDVEMFYDRHLKLWTIYLTDGEGNQISNTEYAPNRKEALYIANNKGLFTMRESLNTFNEGIDGWDNRTGVIKRIANYLYDNPKATPPKGYIPRRSRDYETAANIYGDYVTTPFGNISTDDLMQYARDNKLLDESNELEQRAKKHKKKSKGLGWYPGANFNSNAGDVEKSIEVFNNSVGDLGSGDTGMSMGEDINNNTNTYFYDGPVYYKGHKISDKSSIYTSAPTINIAARNILFRAANGATDFYNYDIDDNKIKMIKSSEQPKPVSKREVCSHCGYELNDMGDCPICDYGEYDLLDEGLSSLEALWTLHRNIDD